MKLLLVEPNFPIPKKSKNHKDFLPIGLLKLASMYRENGNYVKLIRGEKSKTDIKKIGEMRWYVPNEIQITTLFTYWKPQIIDCVQHYSTLFPKAKITLGGIYATLMEEDAKNIPGVNNVFTGIHKEAERYLPAYDLLESNPHPIDYQILHSSRGCNRKCNFCGTWKIEPRYNSEKSIKNRISKNKIVFYDNNFLQNPYIDDILDELIEFKEKKELLWCESQSGFDGRVLLNNPKLAFKLKKAGFRYPRIAWDWSYDHKVKINEQLKLLLDAGYRSNNIFVFMLYNWNIPYPEMEKKRKKCWRWKVQIADCRYRPLNQTFDYYNPRKKNQTNKDYFINKEAGWTDILIKRFRLKVRRQNICVRHGFPFYSSSFERKAFSKDIMRQTKQIKNRKDKIKFLKKKGIDYWFLS